MAIAPLLPKLQPQPKKKIYYPESDGKPMAESDLHQQQMFYCIHGLKAWFADRPEVYVSGNNFLYFVEGEPRQVVSPDCYVVFGAGRGLRPVYKVWEEGGLAPDIVFEITSKKTRLTDEHKKRDLYELLGVSEYYQFDPLGDYLPQRLKASWLENGRYIPVPVLENRLYSDLLHLELVVEGNVLRFYDPLTGQHLPSPEEQAEQLQLERQRANAEAQARVEAERRAQEAEARLAQLQAEMEARNRPGHS